MTFKLSNTLKGKLKLDKWIEKYPDAIKLERPIPCVFHLIVEFDELRARITETENPFEEFRMLLNEFNVWEKEVWLPYNFSIISNCRG